MNFVDALNKEFYSQLAIKPNAAFVRMTCEQISKAFICNEPHTMGGLQIVKRGSLLDDKLRNSKPKLHCIDLTKVE